MLSKTENPIVMMARAEGIEGPWDALHQNRWSLMLLYLARVYGCVSSFVQGYLGRKRLLWYGGHPNERKRLPSRDAIGLGNEKWPREEALS